MSSIDDYKPNSRRSKENKTESKPEKKVEKVVTGNVKLKKKSELSKFKDVFISEDVGNVKSYIFMDVLIPAAKKAISDIVRDGIDMILYGDTKRKSNNYGSSYVSYHTYSDRRNDDRDRDYKRHDYAYSYSDVVIDSRVEAEEVLTRMYELIETYGFVSVADLYDLVGKRCNYTDNNYGWTNIRNANIVRVSGGDYMIKMPKARPLD